MSQHYPESPQSPTTTDRRHFIRICGTCSVSYNLEVKSFVHIVPSSDPTQGAQW